MSDERLVRKNYRLAETLTRSLAERAKADGLTETQIVSDALSAYLRGDEGRTGQQDATEAPKALETAIQALTEQLATKDAQIERLTDALATAQGMARTSQQLEAVSLSKALTSGEEAASEVVAVEVPEAGAGVPEAGEGLLVRFRRWLHR